MIDTRIALVLTLFLVAHSAIACGGEGNEARPAGAETALSSIPMTTSTNTQPTGTNADSEDGQLFEGESYSFRYPDDWQVKHIDPVLIEGIPGEAAFVGPGTPTEGVAVSVFTRDAPLETVKEKREIEAELRENALKQSFRIIEGPTRTEGTGLTGFFMVVAGRNPNGDRIISQQALIIFRMREYLLRCQFAPTKAAEMDAGCNQVLDTLKIEGLAQLD